MLNRSYYTVEWEAAERRASARQTPTICRGLDPTRPTDDITEDDEGDEAGRTFWEFACAETWVSDD